MPEQSPDEIIREVNRLARLIGQNEDERYERRQAIIDSMKPPEPPLPRRSLLDRLRDWLSR